MGDMLLDPVPQVHGRKVFISAKGKYKIVKCALGNDVVPVGAVIYAAKEMKNRERECRIVDMTAIIESVTKQVLRSAGASQSARCGCGQHIYRSTVLAADTPLTKIDQFCKEAIEYKFASRVSIRPM